MVDKTPVNLKTGSNADPTDSNTWGGYTEAAEAMTKINVNANVILHNSGEENMHDSGEKSLWVSFK